MQRSIVASSLRAGMSTLTFSSTGGETGFGLRKLVKLNAVWIAIAPAAIEPAVVIRLITIAVGSNFATTKESR
jgi:hypothetical protein